MTWVLYVCVRTNRIHRKYLAIEPLVVSIGRNRFIIYFNGGNLTNRIEVAHNNGICLHTVSVICNKRFKFLYDLCLMGKLIFVYFGELDYFAIVEFRLVRWLLAMHQ